MMRCLPLNGAFARSDLFGSLGLMKEDIPFSLSSDDRNTASEAPTYEAIGPLWRGLR